MSARNTVILRIQKRYLWSVILTFSKYNFEIAEFRRTVGLTDILRLLQRKTPLFFKKVLFAEIGR